MCAAGRVHKLSSMQERQMVKHPFHISVIIAVNGAHE